MLCIFNYSFFLIYESLGTSLKISVPRFANGFEKSMSTFLVNLLLFFNVFNVNLRNYVVAIKVSLPYNKFGTFSLS